MKKHIYLTKTNPEYGDNSYNFKKTENPIFKMAKIPEQTFNPRRYTNG